MSLPLGILVLNVLTVLEILVAVIGVVVSSVVVLPASVDPVEDCLSFLVAAVDVAGCVMVATVASVVVVAMKIMRI